MPDSLLDKLSKSTAVVKRDAQTPAVKGGGFLTKFNGNKAAAPEAPIPAKPQAWQPMVVKAPPGRLAFVVDATHSRSAAWQEAQSIQRRMFDSGIKSGNFTARVVYYQGSSTCHAYSEWTNDPAKLQSYMAGVGCVTGSTQIVRSLEKCLSFTPPPTVIVLTGDTCEETNDGMDRIQAIGKVLKERKIPVFAFLDGDDIAGKNAFETLAKLSGGAFAKFGASLELGSLEPDLGSLVVATAAYSTGGIASLQELAESSRPEAPAAKALTKQLLMLAAPK